MKTSIHLLKIRRKNIRQEQKFTMIFKKSNKKLKEFDYVLVLIVNYEQGMS